MHPATPASRDRSVVTQQANQENYEEQNACEANKKLTWKPQQQCNKHMVVHTLKMDNTAELTQQGSIIAMNGIGWDCTPWVQYKVATAIEKKYVDL